jgi:hypothetical protein
MHATQVASPFHRPGWVYEEKVDGYRMVAHKDDGAVSIVSRQGKDHTGRYPDLAKALGSLPARSFILDGEIAVYDQAHISRFEWLRARPKDGRATLPVYMAFDVLELDGKDWRPEPLWKRRRVLEELVAQTVDSLTGLTRVAAGPETGGIPSEACDHRTAAIDFDLAALPGSIAALARLMRDELDTHRFFEGVSSHVRQLVPHDRLVLACLEEGGHILSVFGQHAAGGPDRPDGHHTTIDGHPRTLALIHRVHRWGSRVSPTADRAPFPDYGTLHRSYSSDMRKEWAGVSRMTDCTCEPFSGFPKLRLRCADLERLCQRGRCRR